ncbi:MAG: MerR family DNA-binding transcriptional regulator [Candidatus Nealsonbacteria bacterium]
MALHHIPVNKQKKYLKIKEVAELLGITTLTLRNWDKAGKLKPYRHPINNYRVYKPEDIELFLRKLESRKKIILG